MRIDNGRRATLVIDGVFDGICGVSRGVLAFVPVGNRPPRLPLGGALDSEPIILTSIETLDGRAYTARYRVLG